MAAKDILRGIVFGGFPYVLVVGSLVCAAGARLALFKSAVMGEVAANIYITVSFTFSVFMAFQFKAMRNWGFLHHQFRWMGRGLGDSLMLVISAVLGFLRENDGFSLGAQILFYCQLFFVAQTLRLKPPNDFGILAFSSRLPVFTALNVYHWWSWEFIVIWALMGALTMVRHFMDSLEEEEEEEEEEEDLAAIDDVMTAAMWDMKPQL